MARDEVAEVLAKPISQELLGSSIPARPAYVGITVEPLWAKLLDFDTTLPEAVEDLVRAPQDAR
jgi:hypothetical protein